MRNRPSLPPRLAGATRAVAFAAVLVSALAVTLAAFPERARADAEPDAGVPAAARAGSPPDAVARRAHAPSDPWTIDPGIDARRLHQYVRTLAGDAFAGRAPASPGERRTIDWLRETLRSIGCEPGNPDGTWLQRVPLVSITCTNAPALRVRSDDGRMRRELRYGPEFMGWTLHQQARAGVDDAPMVFVGYGVVAPEYHWDDYRGVDVHGRVVVMLVNDPPLEDERMFGGRAMTYYGRWTYKFEEAARQGAAGAILVHDTEAAGYPWAVVENSWSGEQFDIVREDAGASRCQVEGWITAEAARSLFGAAGLDYEAMRRAAATPGFRAVAMPLRASVTIENRIRRVVSHNVVARIPGADPAARDEHVIYTAHWDHLGVGKPVDGDSVYNGALDNATGVAGMLEIARAFAARRDALRRSVLFVFTTAEESGLIGARHYAAHPLYPLAKAVAEINADGLNVWGRTLDMVVVGLGQSDLEDDLARAIAPQGRHVVPDAEPEKGYYYRSDHFALARRGVPALYADSGVEYRGRPKGWGLERRAEYVRERYHKPQDEYDPAWDFSGAVEDLTALFRVGWALATGDRWPRWRPTSEFRRVREAMLRRARAR